MNKYTTHNRKIKTKIQLITGKNASRKWGERKFVAPKIAVSLTKLTSQPGSSKSSVSAA